MTLRHASLCPDSASGQHRPSSVRQRLSGLPFTTSFDIGSGNATFLEVSRLPVPALHHHAVHVVNPFILRLAWTCRPMRWLDIAACVLALSGLAKQSALGFLCSYPKEDP